MDQESVGQFSGAELRLLSGRLRDNARAVNELTLKRRMAEAALAVAELAEAKARHGEND